MLKYLLGFIQQFLKKIVGLQTFSEKETNVKKGKNISQIYNRHELYNFDIY